MAAPHQPSDKYRASKHQHNGMRRRLVRGLEKVLRLPPDHQPPPLCNPADPRIPTPSPIPSTFPLPFTYLRDTDLNPLKACLNSITKDEYGGGHSKRGIDDPRPVSKAGLGAFFDGGSDVNLVGLNTLDLLHKDYILAEDMTADQQERLNIQQLQGQIKLIGSVTLEWYFPDVPGVCFHMPCYVIEGQMEQDVLIGENFIKTVYAAIKHAKHLYGDRSKWSNFKASMANIVRGRMPKRRQSLMSV